MSKIIFCKLSNKINNYKKIENVETESIEAENVETESLETENKSVEIENKIIVNKSIISEKKSYLQLLDKIKTSIANSNGAIKDISASIINIYDNYDKQLLCLQKLHNGTIFDEKKYFIQALKNKLDSYKQQDKKKNI